jgi:hypothetical protein
MKLIGFSINNIKAEKKNGEVVWTYRPLHMTALTVELEYDGKKVWQCKR